MMPDQIKYASFAAFGAKLPCGAHVKAMHQAAHALCCMVRLEAVSSVPPHVQAASTGARPSKMPSSPQAGAVPAAADLLPDVGCAGRMQHAGLKGAHFQATLQRHLTSALHADPHPEDIQTCNPNLLESSSQETRGISRATDEVRAVDTQEELAALRTALQNAQARVVELEEREERRAFYLLASESPQTAGEDEVHPAAAEEQDAMVGMDGGTREAVFEAGAEAVGLVGIAKVEADTAQLLGENKDLASAVDDLQKKMSAAEAEVARLRERLVGETRAAVLAQEEARAQEAEAATLRAALMAEQQASADAGVERQALDQAEEEVGRLREELGWELASACRVKGDEEALRAELEGCMREKAEALAAVAASERTCDAVREQRDGAVRAAARLREALCEAEMRSDAARREAEGAGGEAQVARLERDAAVAEVVEVHAAGERASDAAAAAVRGECEAMIAAAAEERDAAVATAAAVAAERDVSVADSVAAIALRDDAVAQRDDAVVQRDDAVALRDDAVALRDDAVAQRDDAVAQRDDAVAQRDDAVAQRDDAVAQRDDAVAQRDDAVAQRDDAVAQRDDAVALRDDAVAQRDDAVAQRDDAVAQRDDAVAQRDDAVAQRDDAVAQRDDAVAQRDDAVAQRDDAVAQRDDAVAQRDDVVSAARAARNERDGAAHDESRARAAVLEVVREAAAPQEVAVSDSAQAEVVALQAELRETQGEVQRLFLHRGVCAPASVPVSCQMTQVTQAVAACQVDATAQGIDAVCQTEDRMLWRGVGEAAGDRMQEASAGPARGDGWMHAQSSQRCGKAADVSCERFAAECVGLRQDVARVRIALAATAHERAQPAVLCGNPFHVCGGAVPCAPEQALRMDACAQAGGRDAPDDAGLCEEAVELRRRCRELEAASALKREFRAGFVAVKEEIEGLTRELAKAQATAQAHREDAERLRREVAAASEAASSERVAAEQEMGRLRERAREAEGDVAAVRRLAQGLQDDIGALEERYAVLQAAEAREVEAADGLRARLAEVQAALAAEAAALARAHWERDRVAVLLSQERLQFQEFRDTFGCGSCSDCAF